VIDQVEKRPFPFTLNDKIQLRESPEERFPHFPRARRATYCDLQARSLLSDPPDEMEAACQLTETYGKTGQKVVIPVDIRKESLGGLRDLPAEPLKITAGRQRGFSGGGVPP